MRGSGDRVRQPDDPLAPLPPPPGARIHDGMAGHDPNSRTAARRVMISRPDGVGAALSIVVAAVVITGLVVGAELVTWIMMATFFAILVRPFYTWLLRHHVAVPLSLLVVALLLLGIIAALA